MFFWIEADGAKRLPLKAPGEWEPVIPEFVDLVIGVVGMDALGEPIRKIATGRRKSQLSSEKEWKRQLQKMIS